MKSCESCVYRGQCTFPFTRKDAIRGNTCKINTGEFKYYKPIKKQTKKKKK